MKLKSYKVEVTESITEKMWIVQDLFIVGGLIKHKNKEKGNVFNVPSNEHAELNMFLDPLGAKKVFDSELNITLIPLDIQRRVTTFPNILQKLYLTSKTPEVLFARHLLTRLHHLKLTNPRYKHMVKLIFHVLRVKKFDDDLHFI